jgi:hypothetical protein
MEIPPTGTITSIERIPSNSAYNITKSLSFTHSNCWSNSHLDNICDLQNIEYISRERRRNQVGTRMWITFSAIAHTVANGATEKVNVMTFASMTRRFAVRCTFKSDATTPVRSITHHIRVPIKVHCDCVYPPCKYSGASAAVPIGWKFDCMGARQRASRFI